MLLSRREMQEGVGEDDPRTDIRHGTPDDLDVSDTPLQGGVILTSRLAKCQPAVVSGCGGAC